MIYLASPYTHDDKDVVLHRVKMVCIAAGELMRQGHSIISPIAHCHSIAMEAELPTDYEFWHKYNHELIGICQQYWILCLDGWQESVGIIGETEYADSIARVIRYVDPISFRVFEKPTVVISF